MQAGVSHGRRRELVSELTAAPTAAGGSGPSRTTDGRSLATLPRQVRRFVGGAFLANVGTYVIVAGSAIIIYERTDNAGLVGLSGVALIVPFVLGALFGGHLGDQRDRRALLIGSMALSAAASASGAVILAVDDGVGLLVIVVLPVVGGFLGTGLTSAQALLPGLCGREDLPSAVAWYSGQANAARAVGPALAGLLIWAVGGFAIFAVHAGLAVAWILLVLELPRGSGQTASVDVTPFATWLGMLVSRDGRPLVATVLLVFATGVLTMPLLQITPVLATDRFSLGEGAAGLLTSLFGLGAVAAAVSYATWGGNRTAARVLPLSFGGIAVALALTAVSPALWLVGLSLLLAGACLQMSSASLNVTLQLAAAEQTRARTMSAYMAALALGLPVGSAIHGALIETWGTGAGLALAAALSGVVTAGLLASRSYSAFLLATWSPPRE